MQKFYQRLKENQKERARCAFLVLYFGVLAVLLFLTRPLLDTTAADREWSIHFLFPCLLACIILTTVVSFCRFAAKPDQKPKPRYVGWKQPILMLANAAYLFATLEFVTNSQFREMKWYYALLNIGVIFVLSILVSLFLNSIRRAMIFMNIFYFCMSTPVTGRPLSGSLLCLSVPRRSVPAHRPVQHCDGGGRSRRLQIRDHR